MSDWWQDRASALRSFPPPIPHRMESMRGPAYTNWVIKNHVLMGPHPGSVTTADMVKNLTSILQVGVTTFVCLQHEMPTPNISKAGASEPSSRARSSFGPGVVVHAKPYIEDAQIIAEHAGMPQVSADRPLTFLHLPIHKSNGATTTDDSLMAFVVKLVQHIKAGELLYIQCGDGDGRSGTLAALLLGLFYDLSSSEALDLTQRCRAFRMGTEGYSPDSHEQKMQVHRLLGKAEFRDAAKAAPAKSSCDVVKNPDAEVDIIVTNIRSQLSAKSPMSFLRLQSRLAAMGDRAHALAPVEFARTLAAGGLALTDDEIRVLLVAFQSRRSPTAGGALVVDAHRCLAAVRGGLSDMRMTLVRQAYATFEPDARTGFINTSSVVRRYQAAAHPDVKSGRRTQADIQAEFLDSFKVRSNTDGHVTLQDFVDYYTDVSAAIDDDNFFQLLMFNSWALGSKPRAAADSAGMPSHGIDDGRWDPRSDDAPGSVYTPPKSMDALVVKARKAAATLGDFGIAKLAQALADQDVNHDGWVTQGEAERAVAVLKLPLHRTDVMALFRGSRPEAGQVHIDGFVSFITGTLSPFRRKLVLSAFNRLDVEGTGRVPLAAATAQFKADSHPAVKASRARPETILREFLSTFADGAADGFVTLPHFERYYEGVSAVLPDDDEFQVTIWSTWNLSGPRTPLRSTATPETSYTRARDGDDGFWGSVDRLNSIGKRASPAVKSTGKAQFRAHPAQALSATVVGSGGSQARPHAAAPPPPPPDDVIAWTRGDRGRRHDTSAHRKLYEPSGVVLHHEGAEGDDVAKLRAQFQHHASVGTQASVASTPSSPSRIRAALRAHCATYGVKGLLNLERRLQTAGKGNPYIPSDTFVSALRDFAVPLGPEEFTALLRDEDPDGRGYIDARRFLAEVRGKLSGHRLELVESAFRKLDADDSGAVDANEIRLRYNTRNHPDVKAGKRSESEVLREFLETCDLGRDGTVSMGEFCDYYAAVSATIPEDSFFQMLVWSTWDLQGTSAATSSFSPQRHNLAAGVSATSDAEFHLTGAGVGPAPVRAYQGAPPSRRDAAPSVESVDIASVIASVRETFVRRGITGFSDLARSFRIIDRDRTGTMSQEELARILKMYGCGFSPVQVSALFKYFDRDGSRAVSLKEFLRGIRGSIPDSRVAIIQKAFEKLDVDASGAVDVTDMALCFNPRSNPDVLSGKITERDALKTFLDNFDMDRDGRVTFEEFVDLYANISATIDDDEYFRLLMWNAWSLGEPHPARRGAPRR